MVSGETISSTRRYDSHARTTTHLDLGEAERQQAAILRSEQSAGWDDNLAKAHVLLTCITFFQAPQAARPRSRWRRSSAFSTMTTASALFASIPPV